MRPRVLPLMTVLWFVPWLIITSPWWIYNYNLTGSIIPTSGMMQTMHRTTGSYFPLSKILTNVNHTVTALLDQAFLFVVTPQRLIIRGTHLFSLVWNISRAALLGTIVLWFRFKAKPVSHNNLRNILVGKLMFFPLFIGLILVYYNFFFNVAWYINRYTIPCIIAPALIWPLVLERYKLIYCKVCLIAGITLTLLIGGTSYFTEYNSMYIEHYGWVEENVPEDTWVAANQTGTLGYFHDRTINVDGKVNPDIFKIAPGTKGEYLKRKNVKYFIDWKEMTIFRNHNFLKWFEFYQEFGRCLVFKRKEMMPDTTHK